jgi:predicted alpha/beta hydrolase
MTVGESAVAIETVRIPARDGRALAATRYSATMPGDKVVIVNSATGVKRGLYHRYARFLADNGLEVLTYDYRGIGDSAEGGIRAQRCTMREWGEIDVASVIDYAAARYPGRRLFAVGHSAGGQMFGLADNNARVEGLFAVSAQSGYWKHWRGAPRWRLALLWHLLMPGMVSLFSYFPSKRIGLGENLPGDVAREWARWCRHPDYLVDREGRPLRQHFEAYRGRIRACVIGDDWMAPQAAVEALMGFYRSAEVELKTLQPADAGAKALGHFGYFREIGKPLWGESLAWFREQ